MLESELYPPIKYFLEQQGYEVKGEVGDCDVVAVRGSEGPVIVELKLNLNLTVLLQAVDRFSLSDTVYIGLPHQCSILKSQKKKRVIKLLRQLNVGLVVIQCNQSHGFVEVLLDPGPYQPRLNGKHQQRLLGEFAHRVGDPNAGGSDRRQGLLTVYRQRALAIAQCLGQQGATKASVIAQQLGDSKARDILYRDVYGWFDRHGKGVYSLSPKGVKEIKLWQVISK